MANNELSFRRELSRDAKSQGAFVISTVADGGNKGLPDMFIKFPSLEGVWVELKWIKTKKGVYGENHKIKLSELQKKWFRDYRKVGGVVSWVCGCNLTGYGTRLSVCGVGESIIEPTTNNIVSYHQKRVGEEWPMKTIVEKILETRNTR